MFDSIPTSTRTFEREGIPEFKNTAISKAEILEQRRFLTPVYGFKNLTCIPATSGTGTVFDYLRKGMFRDIGMNYLKFGFKTASLVPTSAHRIVFGEETIDSDLCGIIPRIQNLRRRFLRQEQVAAFCGRFPGLIDLGAPTFFPVVNDRELNDDLSNLFVASVIRRGDEVFEAGLYELKDPMIIPKELNARFGYLY